jgi:kinetochore protein Spc24
MQLCKFEVSRRNCQEMLIFCRLKLKLYRTLGIDVEADKTTGEYNKAIIRNAAKGDVHVVNIDPKFSRHFYTNYFWRTM